MKLYESEAWLRLKVSEGMTVDEIARSAGASRRTIYYYLKKFGIKI